MLTRADVTTVSRLLLGVREGASRPADLPIGLIPGSWDEVYAIQDEVAHAQGRIVAWKVGASDPASEPFRAPITDKTCHMGATTLGRQAFNVIGAEAEIAYEFAHALPPRPKPYSTDEVRAAVSGVRAAIEIVDTRFAAFGKASRMSHMADQANHGVLVLGALNPDWARVVPLELPNRLLANGNVLSDRAGGNVAGDPIRMLVWMANVGTVSEGGIKVGDVITTGSFCGSIFVEAPTRIVVELAGVGQAELAIA